MMLNSFSPRKGINTSQSSRTIISGIKLDYNEHCKMPFGDYAQTHEEDTPHNSMKPRTYIRMLHWQ